MLHVNVILLEVVFMIQNRYLDQHEFALVPSHSSLLIHAHEKMTYYYYNCDKEKKILRGGESYSASSPWLLH